MGRKAKFTQEEVFSAADAMAAEGLNISPAELLNRLGGGSYTTLYRHLEAWRAGPGAPLPAVVLVMPPAVHQALDQVWQVYLNYRTTNEIRCQAALLKARLTTWTMATMRPSGTKHCQAYNFRHISR